MSWEQAPKQFYTSLMSRVSNLIDLYSSRYIDRYRIQSQAAKRHARNTRFP